MQKEDKKRVIIFTIIGILTILVTLVGATFAYIRIDINTNARTSMKTKSANAGGLITFATKTESLSFEISDNEMSDMKIGTKYYATKDVAKKFALESEEHVFKLAEASVSNGDYKYDCKFKFNIRLGENSTMIPESRGEVVLEFSGDGKIKNQARFDLLDLIQNNVVIEGEFDDLTLSKSKSIDVSLYVLNTDKEQAPFLANKRLNIIIEPLTVNSNNDIFECEIDD